MDKVELRASVNREAGEPPYYGLASSDCPGSGITPICCIMIGGSRYGGYLKAVFISTEPRPRGSTVRLSQTLRGRGLLLAQSAPHGKQKPQTPNRDSSLPLPRLPTLRPKRSGEPLRA